MDILYFVQFFYPSVFGGGEYLFFLVSRELARQGHGVDVITQRVTGTQQFEEIDGLKIHRIGAEVQQTLRPTMKRNLSYTLHGLKKAREIISNKKRAGKGIDIIHTAPYFGTFIGHICSKLYHIPHIATFHNVYQANAAFWKDWMKKDVKDVPFYTPYIANFVERLTLKLSVSKIHTVSQMSKEELTSFGVKGSKITVISPGIESSQYRNQPSLATSGDDGTDSCPSAIFLGRLIAYKNLPTVIKAFKKVVERLPKAQLIIIGDGPIRNGLLEEAKTIDKNVIFKGTISEREKIELIHKASFVVFPSLVEGFGIAVIEGFACKKPVLVSDVRPLSDIVKDGHTGFIIPRFDVSLWSHKMLTLFEDERMRKEMGEKAYEEFLSRYELTTTLSNMEKLYTSFLPNKDQSGSE